MKKFFNKILSMDNKQLFILLMIARIPYFLIYYPGLMIYDTGDSIQQFYGYASESLVVTANPTATLSNHHLIVFTYLFGGFIKLGEILGSQNFGLFLFTFLQTILSNVIIIKCLNILKNKCNTKAYIGCLLYYALFPIYSLWQMTMGKDPMFSIFVMWMCLLLYELADSNAEILKNKRYVRDLIICSICFAFTKQQASYIAIIIAVVLLVVYRKRIIKAATIIVLPGLFYLFIFTGIILPACNVALSGRQEMMGFMFQQTAVAVIDHGDEITKEEKEAITNVLPYYDKMEENYSPYTQDTLKFTYNQQSTTEENIEYVVTWFKMFFKYPLSYIKATALNFENFVLEVDDEGFMPKFPEKNALLSRAHPETFDLYCVNPIHGVCRTLMVAFGRLPFISSLCNAPFYVWSTAIIGLYSIIKKKKEVIISMLPMLITLLVLVVTPVESFRYVLPLVYPLPFIVCLAFFKKA